MGWLLFNFTSFRCLEKVLSPGAYLNFKPNSELTILSCDAWLNNERAVGNGLKVSYAVRVKKGCTENLLFHSLVTANFTSSTPRNFCGTPGRRIN